MAAIITDLLRVKNARSFIEKIRDPNKSYYTFIGLPNATEVTDNWNVSPPSPRDCFDDSNTYWDTMIALKKIAADDVRPVVRKVSWASATIYDMYRHDVNRNNLSKPSNKTSLYASNYYVVNSEFRVYICLNNGIDPENPNGRPSLDEPKFTDLEPRAAGTSGDGYIWKYLYTISPSDVIKFDSLNFIPVPVDWETNSDYQTVRNNASTSGQLKTVTIRDRGFLVGPPNITYSKVPIKGDGSDAECTIVINNDSKVESITISNGGSGYTYGTVDLIGGNVPTGSNTPIFDVVIPPPGGHGADIYSELGSTNVLIYSRIENDEQNPDFVTGTAVARIGIVEDPRGYQSNTILTEDRLSTLRGLVLKGIAPNEDDYRSTTFEQNAVITQTVGTGVTAVGRVVAYDAQTGVLRYWQDRSLVGFNTDGTQKSFATYGFQLNPFTADTLTGGSLKVVGGSKDLYIDQGFGTDTNPGISTVINNKTYYLGQTFIKGVADPEVEKYSGTILYVDNRPSITRSVNQREDIKVILQF
jgi:hypothetical protein